MRPDWGHQLILIKEGQAADAAIAEAGKRTLSRRELSRHQRFEQVSPDVGELDESALDEALADAPDDTLAMLADLTSATDPKLRELARRLAGRLMLDIARRGTHRAHGVGRMTMQSYQPDAGDIDIDASLDAINELRRHGATDVDQLKVRGWMKPSTALCLVVDRSGSMGGRPLANSAVATAAVAARNPGDYSVVVFGGDVIVAKSQDANKDAQEVVNAVLRLRGFGTTNLSEALLAAHQQLQRSRAGRKVTVLLSDCRATVLGDVIGAARSLEELVILAPDGDDEDAQRLGAQVGARVTTVCGPSDIPDAFARVFD